MGIVQSKNKIKAKMLKYKRNENENSNDKRREKGEKAIVCVARGMSDQAGLFKSSPSSSFLFSFEIKKCIIQF